MPRSLKSYAGFFCPTSPVSSLLTAKDNPEDHHFYTRDNLSSVFDKYHRNTFELNLMCAWELIFGKHYHDLHEPLSNQAHFAKGILDYLIFPLIARGLGDCTWMLIGFSADNFLATFLVMYPILAISAVIIALELTRLVLGLPFVLPAWGIIAAIRTLTSKPSEANELDVIDAQLQKLPDLLKGMGAFYIKNPGKETAGKALAVKLISFTQLLDNSQVLTQIQAVTPELDAFFENTSDTTGMQQQIQDILKACQNCVSKEETLRAKEEQTEAWRLQWK